LVVHLSRYHQAGYTQDKQEMTDRSSSTLATGNDIAAGCLIAANGFFSFGVMVSYAVCIDIGRNNAGTVTGAMNFCGQMGAFFLAIIFGKIVQQTNNFNYPLFVVAGVAITGCLLWMGIDAEKKLKLSDL